MEAGRRRTPGECDTGLRDADDGPVIVASGPAPGPTDGVTHGLESGLGPGPRRHAGALEQDGTGKSTDGHVGGTENAAVDTGSVSGHEDGGSTPPGVHTGDTRTEDLESSVAVATGLTDMCTHCPGS